MHTTHKRRANEGRKGGQEVVLLVDGRIVLGVGEASPLSSVTSFSSSVTQLHSNCMVVHGVGVDGVTRW